jgi:hypothetical protein
VNFNVPNEKLDDPCLFGGKQFVLAGIEIEQGLAHLSLGDSIVLRLRRAPSRF